MARRRSFSVIGIVLLAVSIVCGLTYLVSQGLPHYPASVVVKALSISPLALIAFLILPNRDGLILGTSLLFSSLGDVLLGIDNDKLFVFGLGSFFIAHLLYIILFFRSLPKPLLISLSQRLLVIAVILYSAGMMLWLLPDLDGLTGPVAAYICAITAMGVTAILARFSTAWIATGALLFMLSDSIIAVTKFKMPIAYRDYIVWSTYFSGQLLIAVGFLHEKLRTR